MRTEGENAHKKHFAANAVLYSDLRTYRSFTLIPTSQKTIQILEIFLGVNYEA